MTTTAAPTRAPYAARRVSQAWDRLAAPTPDLRLFDVAALGALPEPARRWLLRAVDPATPCWESAVVTMTGHIRIGTWRPFTATQVIAPGRGYVWAARARVRGLPVVGFDRLSDGTGQMSWRLLDAFPVVRADGPDTTRSALGRLVSEIVLVPTAYDLLDWTPGPTPDTVCGTLTVGSEVESAQLDVAPDGTLRSVLVDRWASPRGEPFARVPFGVDLSGELAGDGVRVPASVRAGWWWGTDRQAEGEFFRADITSVRLR